MSRFKLGLSLVKKNIRPLFLFELLYKLCGGLLFTPAIYGLFSLSLKFAGIQYVSEKNLLWFLSRPATIVSIILAILMLTVFTLTEMTTLTHGLHASYHGRKITLRRMVGRGAATALRALLPQNWLLVLFVVMMVPFAHGMLLSGFLPSISLPDSVLAFLRARLWLALLAVALILALYLLVMRWVFAMHTFTLGRVSFHEARKESVRLLRHRLGRDILLLIVWIILLFVLLALVFLLIAAAGLALIKLICSARVAVSVALGFISLLLTIFGIVASALEVPVACALTSALYYDEKRRAGEAVEPFWEYPPRSAVKARRSRVATVVTLCGVGTVLAGAIASGISNVSRLGDADITAHRGDAVSAPENTLPAFESAIEHGADYIELDVQLTADGEVIVMHDLNLKRVNGLNADVRDLSYAALRGLDVGAWFSPDFAGTTIPTLAEVLELVDGRAELIIELKGTAYGGNLTEKVVRLVQQYEAEDWCVIMTPEYALLRQVKELAPELRTAYLLKAVYGSLSGLDYADAFSIRSLFVTQRIVDRAHSEDKEVYVWTVNKADTVRKLLDLRVDNIITDDPVMVREVQSSERVGGAITGLVYDLFSDKE